jgi:Xaa-Pro aminopeptidase
MDYINELNLNVLLIDGDLTLSDFETYKPLLTAKSLKIANMKSLRCIKTDEEIKLMQIAADIACDAVAHVKENIKVGMSEQQVADMIKVFMITAGASGLSFPSIVSFGTNTADIHHMPSATKKLESGELIMLDLGCVYKGYCSDITRCF